MKRKLVIPGELIKRGISFISGEGTYRVKEAIYASKLGLVEEDKKLIRVIPLSGVYIPKENDIVIGKIVEVTTAGWLVDINSPYIAFLPVGEALRERIDLLTADLSNYFDVGDIIISKVISVTKSMLVRVSLKEISKPKLEGGKVIKVSYTKVPRIIGKGGSMINMIKELTSTSIFVGQNGVIWVKGKGEGVIKAIKAIYKIEEEAHTEGLTEKIRKMLGDANERKKKR